MHVEGWWKCPCCKGRLFVEHAVPERLECIACGEELEPILQADRGPRERAPGARLVSEVSE